VIENVEKFLHGQVGKGKDHAGPERQGRIFGPETLDDVFAQDRQNIPALQAQRSKSARGSFDPLDHVAPGVGDPHAMPLLTHTGACGMGLRAIDQELRQGFAAGGSSIIAAGGPDDHCFACPR